MRPSHLGNLNHCFCYHVHMEMDKFYQIPVHGAHDLPACRDRTGNINGSNIMVSSKVSNIMDEIPGRLTDRLCS